MRKTKQKRTPQNENEQNRARNRKKQHNKTGEERARVSEQERAKNEKTRMSPKNEKKNGKNIRISVKFGVLAMVWIFGYFVFLPSHGFSFSPSHCRALPLIFHYFPVIFLFPPSHFLFSSFYSFHLIARFHPCLFRSFQLIFSSLPHLWSFPFIFSFFPSDRLVLSLPFCLFLLRFLSPSNSLMFCVIVYISLICHPFFIMCFFFSLSFLSLSLFLSFIFSSLSLYFSLSSLSLYLSMSHSLRTYGREKRRYK